MRKEYLERYYEIDKTLSKECGNCGSKDDLEIHHIVPLAFGGTNRLSNLVRLCSSCHSKAHGGFSFIDKSEETLRKRASQGKRTLGSIPLGYEYKNDEFVVNEDDAKIVRLIFRMRYEYEYSTSNIAKALNHMAIPTQRGAKEWSHPTIMRILNNKKYFGDYEYKGENYGQLIHPILDERYAKIKRKFEEKYKNKRVKPRHVLLG